MTAPVLRLATERDIGVIQMIEAAGLTMFPPESLPPGAGRLMPVEELAAARSASLLWVACFQRDEPVGFLAAEVVSGCLHIWEMDVLPAHGRRGVGGALLQQATIEAARRGLYGSTLTTFDHLPWNAPFYSKHGFAAVEAFERFPHLLSILQDEQRRGLEHRVAMVKKAA